WGRSGRGTPTSRILGREAGGRSRDRGARVRPSLDEAEWEVLEAAQDDGAPPDRRTGEREVRKARQQPAERGAGLHARELRARAEVRADAEADVRVGRAREIQPVRLGECGRIAV